jgi:hypothetical protein
VILFIIFVVVLAVWKGGEPFRWTGEKTETIGRIIQEVGDRIDEIKQGSKKAGKKIKELSEDIEKFTKDRDTPPEKENETVNNDKKSE